MYRKRSQYQRLTPLDYVCRRGVVVRALGNRGEPDASSNPITIILVLLSLYSENNPIHYFHCTVRITLFIIFTVQ